MTLTFLDRATGETIGATSLLADSVTLHEVRELAIIHEVDIVISS